ncbi:MAG: hypothetical protein KAY65_14780, partial [Planctomycetes bacterium]|nr:hypothetical protein [Planctomycetota bacterium]
SSTHHPGLAGILEKRNCRTRSRISRKEYPWHSHFRHLKYHVTGMADHQGSYLDEPNFFA